MIGEIVPLTVTQSKTFENDEYLYKAEHATDKDLSTFSIAPAEIENGEVWLKLEFDRIYPIYQIVIYQIFYTDFYDRETYCARNVSNYQQCKGVYTDVNVDILQGSELQETCGVLQLSAGLTQDEQIYEFPCVADGDTVVLSKTSAQIAVTEIVVLIKGK